MGRTSDADQRLMNAALSLMWEQSYGAVTIDDICRRAKVKKGSFYYFFSSKSDLALQALEWHWQQRKGELDGYFAPAKSPLERIRDKCEATYRHQLKVQRKTGHVLGCRLCCLGSEICTQDEVIRDKVRDLLAREARYWEQAIQEAQALGQLPPGDAAARTLGAMAFYAGMVGQARLHNDAEILRDLPSLMMDHLRAGTPVDEVASI
jgi:TetR/AcrR family transcriptional regulator, transcriptional repressor for nem operon